MSAPLEVKHWEPSGWTLGRSMTGGGWAVRGPDGLARWCRTEHEAWALLDELAPNDEEMS